MTQLADAEPSVNSDCVEIAPPAILARMGEETRLAGPAGTALWPSIRMAAAGLPLRPYGAVVLTGCGDSYYAALCLRSLVETAVGVPVLAIPAMDAASYPPLIADEGSLLVGISVSGKVERTIEAVTNHRARGGVTVSISAFGDTDLAAAADQAIATRMRGTPGPVPGTANFLGSMLGVLAIATELADRAGREAHWAGDISRVLAGLSGFVSSAEQHAAVVATDFDLPFYAVGSGPDLGTASYGIAKFIEAAAAFGVAQDLEEWAHEQYFTTGPGTTVFVHATNGRSLPRARRVALSVLRVGGRVVSIGPEPLGLSGEHHWPTAPAPEPLRPLVAWVPMAVAARTYALQAGRYPFGIDLPDRMQTVDDDIYLAERART